ncbi:MAG: hypothetical protein MAG794_01316 [Gammaproteobacteria bacterium]|nr:hypothetical protein [Gammaproteobacteria bacterium]
MRWDAFAYINRTEEDFDSGRNDEILDYGFGVDYALRPWLSVGGGYTVIERDSSVAGEDYEDEIFTVKLSGQFGNR